MKHEYEAPELALFRLSASVLTGSQPDPDEWETEIIGVENDYTVGNDDA